MQLVGKTCEEWELSLSLFITDAVCCCLLPFFLPEVSPAQYKVARGEMKATLFQSWVTVTDGHVHSAKTNSSGGKHTRAERCRRKDLPGSPFIAGSGKSTTCFHRCGEGHLNTCAGRNVRAEEPARMGSSHPGW